MSIKEIKPHKYLGDFIIGDSLNKVLSIIKQKGKTYQQCDIIVNKSYDEPIYLIIKKEGIKLRFGNKYQKLELIEKTFPETSDLDYSYNNKIVFSNNIKEHIYYSKPNYNYISSNFGMSKMPKYINNSKNVLLPYDGISFIFYNNDNEDINESSYINPNLNLYKLLIFSDNSLLTSLSKDAKDFQNPIPLVKYNIDNKITYICHYENNLEDVSFSFDETLEDILNKLKNPNYVHNANKNNDLNNNLTNASSNNNEIILNYFSYGIDIFVDEKLNLSKKFIFHTNNLLDNKFGIYEKCNFEIYLTKKYFKDILESTENSNLISTSNVLTSYRKFSDEVENNKCLSPRSGKSDNSLGDEKDHKELEIETVNFCFINGKEEGSNEVEDDNSEKDKDREYELNEKGDIFNEVVVYPWSNFARILKFIPKGTYTQYQKYDNKINRLYKYYLFSGIVFETLEDGSITSVVIYKK